MRQIQVRAAKGGARAVCAGLLLFGAAAAPAQNESSGAGGFRLPPDGRSSGVQGPANDGIPPLTADDAREPAPAPRSTTPPPPPEPPTASPASPAQAARSPAALPRSGATAPARQPRGSGTAAAAAPTANAVPRPDVTESALGDSVEGRAAGGDTMAAEDAAPGSVSTAVVPAATAPGWIAHWPYALALGALLLLLGLFGGRRRARAAAADGPADFERPVPPAAPQPQRPAPQKPASQRPTPAPAPEPELLLDTAAAESMLQPKSGNVTLPIRAMVRRPRVEMALQLEKMEVMADALVVGFRLHLTNSGELPASSALVRVALMQARSGQESAIQRFFEGTGGRVLADGDAIEPGTTVHVDADVQLPLAAVTPLNAGGKPILVPVLVLDTSYHWDGGDDAFGQVAAAYVLGQEPASADEGARLGPVPLDGPRFVARPGARVTGLQLEK